MKVKNEVIVEKFPRGKLISGLFNLSSEILRAKAWWREKLHFLATKKVDNIVPGLPSTYQDFLAHHPLRKNPSHFSSCLIGHKMGLGNT